MWEFDLPRCDMGQPGLCPHPLLPGVPPLPHGAAGRTEKVLITVTEKTSSPRSAPLEMFLKSALWVSFPLARLWWLTLAGHQVPTKAALIAPPPQLDRGENTMEGSWVEIRAV